MLEHTYAGGRYRGKMRHSITEKLEAFHDYFQILYKAEIVEESSIDKLLNDVEIARLTEEQLWALEHPIEPCEIADAIKSLKSNTAPGPDGFTVKFYKKV